MNPRVVGVQTTDDRSLVLTFADGEVRRFSVAPYLDAGIFGELRDPAYFRAVRVVLGSVQWPNGQDFCPDTLYLDSLPCPATEPAAV